MACLFKRLCRNLVRLQRKMTSVSSKKRKGCRLSSFGSRGFVELHTLQLPKVQVLEADRATTPVAVLWTCIVGAFNGRRHGGVEELQDACPAKDVSTASHLWNPRRTLETDRTDGRLGDRNQHLLNSLPVDRAITVSQLSSVSQDEAKVCQNVAFLVKDCVRSMTTDTGVRRTGATGARRAAAVSRAPR